MIFIFKYFINYYFFYFYIWSFFLIDNKTFDVNKKLLLITEKYKLIYVNGFLGGVVNAISIIYLIRRKCYEQLGIFLNELNEVRINIKEYLFYFLIIIFKFLIII